MDYIMKNIEEKKAYRSPEMEIVEMSCFANLLQCSSDDGCGSKSFGIRIIDVDDEDE